MRSITRKSMLYKTEVDYTTDRGDQLNDYAMNHVLGCSHGCKYPCYAMANALRWGQVESYEDWRDPKPVANALALLEKELARKKDIRRIHLCFTTDPLPDPFANGVPFERQAVDLEIRKMTCRAVEMINAAGIPVTLLTKSYFGGVERWQRAHPDNYYGISLVSLNEKFREQWEPNTAPYAERLESLKALHDAGFKTWVSMEPFPALTSVGYERLYGSAREFTTAFNSGAAAVERLSLLDGVPEGSVRAFDPLVATLRAVGFVDRIVFGRWNYNRQMPTDVEDVGAWYRGAAKIVREFCAERGIECVIKRGVE